VNVRAATKADEEALRALWAPFEVEVPEPAGFPPESWEEQWRALERSIEDGSVYVAEDGGALVAVVELLPVDRGVTHVEWAYVEPTRRRQGLMKELLRHAVANAKERGARTVSLEALISNQAGLDVWHRLGFQEVEYFMAAQVDALEARLDDAVPGVSKASTHVQTDDRVSVDRAVSQFIPRLKSPEVVASDNGWIRIADPLFDEDRSEQSRFAGDLSDRLGAVSVALALEEGAVVRFRIYERGRMVDEYLSVPTYYGPVSKADELAYAANPTLVARLTGAAHDDVHKIARTAATPADLPPADELYRLVAALMGLEP
jgi:ribosomal protein S18 acetylase RimI-like enzyme